MQTIVCIFATMEKDVRAILFGKKISEIRESKGFSIRKLAKNVGISDTALAKIETGSTKSITIELGRGLSKELGISFNELFEIDIAEIGENSQEKIAQLEKSISELRDQLNDKRKLTIWYEDTAEYLQLFMKFASEVIEEDENIKASDLLNQVKVRIGSERGKYTFAFTENGVRFKFLTEDEQKMLDIAITNSTFSKK